MIPVGRWRRFLRRFWILNFEFWIERRTNDKKQFWILNFGFWIEKDGHRMKNENETKKTDERPGASSGLIGLIVGAILGGFSGILIGWVIWG